MLKRVEVHITYKCDLGCLYCNRGCFSHIEFAPDLKVDQFRDFLDECNSLNFKLDDIVIIGGEPALHPQCIEFIKLSKDYVTKNGGQVILFSNNYSERSHSIIEYVKSNSLCVIYEPTFKTKKVNHAESDDDFCVFISPTDIAKKRIDPCGCYTYCGFSMDSLGYTCCSLGGMISSLLCPEVRTRNLRDLLDEDFTKRQLSELCRHCGTFLCKRSDVSEDMLYELYGNRMTKTWYYAFKNAQMRDHIK